MSELDKIILTKAGKVNPNSSRLLNKNPELLSLLISKTNHLPSNASLSERLYNYVNKINDIKLCPICLKKIEFKSHSYAITCSYKCYHEYEKNIIVDDCQTLRQIRTNKVKISNNKIGEDGLTSYSRGVKHMWENIRKKENATEIINSMRRKTVETKIKNNSFNEERLRAAKTRKIKTLNKILLDKFEILNEHDFLNCFKTSLIVRCKKCNNIHQFPKHRIIPNFICQNCFPSSRSSIESKILSLLKEHNIKFECNKKKYLDNEFELDIFCPDYNIAIEINGDYFHSEKFISKEYHLNKYKKCLDKNIILFQFFENEINFKFEIVKSIILNKLNLTSNKINGRDCIVKNDIALCDVKKFLNNTHIQGYCSATKYIGLYHNNELVQLMSFRKPRFNKKYDWEIIRNSTKLNTIVRGGTSKLLSFFKKNNKGTIITYVDLRFGNGDSYMKSDGKFLYTTVPNYWYIWNNKMYNRYSFQKHKLCKLLGDKFDENLTEHENAIKIGALKTWDIGNNIFIFE